MRFLAGLCILVLVGCTSVPKSPQELKISRVSILAGDNETKVEIAGLPGKGTGAAIGGGAGAGVGAGVGLGLAPVLCAGTGMAYPGCVGFYLLLATGSGVAAGSGIGAVTTESASVVQTKRGMLSEALIALDASQNLAPLVYKNSLEPSTVTASPNDKAAATTDPEWTLRITLDEFATVGSGPDKPYSLQLSASIEIRRIVDQESVFRKDYQANSPLPMTTAEWRANDDEPVFLALDGLLATLATEISNDLKPIQLSLDQPMESYKVHVMPVATEVQEESVAALTNEAGMKAGSVGVPQSQTVNGLPLVEKETSNPDESRLFDTTTGLNWIIVPTNPVDLSSANIICASLETGDDRKYRVPSLREFKDLWKKYKNDERIRIFKKREYCTDGKHNLQRTAYVRTFSFSSGSEGSPSQIRAADLTCVSK